MVLEITKVKLEKFKMWCKFASEGLTKYDFALLFVSYLLMALAKDLNLENLLKVSGSFFMLICIWYLCTFVCLLVLYFIKKLNEKKQKKLEIEKIIEEESKKD